MSSELETPLPIFRVGVSEINVTFINGLPQGQAKIQLKSSEGIVIAESIYSSWGEGTWKGVTDLCQKIEKDFCEALRNDSFFQWNDEPAETGISYKETDNKVGDWK